MPAAAGLVYEENFKLIWRAAALADNTAPTVAELTPGAGIIDFTDYVPKDGVQPGGSNSRVSGGSLSRKFTPQSMGAWTSELTVAFKRRLADDAESQEAWETFNDTGITGTWIMLPFGGELAAGIDAYVFPNVESGTPLLKASAENEEQQFTTEWACREEPVWDAVVAA